MMNNYNPKWLFVQNREEAKRAQCEMAEKVFLKDTFHFPIQTIAGMDVSNTPFDPKQLIFAATVSLSYPSLQMIQTTTQVDQQIFPYIPGLLGFREAPTLVRAYQQLSCAPDLVMVDGHGVSHPRKLGIASHLGVLLDLPTIGVAKSILVGKPAGPLSEEIGSTVPLLWKQEEIAMLVRTKKRCLPLIISAGHKITLKTAVELVLACIRGRRLPEPTWQAHIAANLCRKNYF